MEQLAGVLAVVLLGGATVLAWFLGGKKQEAVDRERAMAALAERLRAEAKATEEAHGDAIDALDPDDLRRHVDDMVDDVLRRSET